MKLNEETIHKETLYEGKIVDLHVHDVKLPNGSQSKREIITHPGAVAIIAITLENKLVMVKQFRKALEKEIIEIPAGKLEKGEKPAETAKRELAEETGYIADELDKVLSFYTSPGFSDEIVYLYETAVSEKGGTATDEDEFVEVMEVTVAEAEKMIDNEEIHDAKTIFAVQYIKSRLP
ncbi:NUDIX hydrolase [Bacillus piscicola]|uniref:NUDIX hydrolase n=1 Tax=Bacillus piscicola TaxID=1632684 RepID=UPI001F091C10|nr:NUDIX hydrolase [Bacillus piscicola]